MKKLKGTVPFFFLVLVIVLAIVLALVIVLASDAGSTDYDDERICLSGVLTLRKNKSAADLLDTATENGRMGPTVTITTLTQILTDLHG